MNGTLSVGALVASMAIVWRMLTPLQTGFIGITKAQQIRQSLQQFNQLMRLKRERNPMVAKPTGRALRGGVRFKRVGYRPPGASDPALLGVSFDIRPGEVVAVTGPAGAGKSSLLDLLAGLVQPQAGAVELDGVDLRQHDPGELRRQIGFLPQGTGFLHGTVAQNLRLGNPLARDEDLREAAAATGCIREIEALPAGFDTRLTEAQQRSLSAAFAQKLLLARTFLSEGRILLLDDPGRNLDEEGERALNAHLDALRGRSTVIFTTQRQSQIAMADKVLVLDRGQLVSSGDPETAFAIKQGR
jgi:ATP-binding cassette subfamily C protein/ATP-binding cassette subfamily C protein LapB